MPDALQWPGLALLGVLVGAYGTVIGAGGGFLLTPLLLLLYPSQGPEVITAISLGVVFVNATSGAQAYARQKRVDTIAVPLFAAATMPGAIIGALIVGGVPRQLFEALFALLLLAVALMLNLRPPGRIVTTPPPGRYIRRVLTDANGETYVYSFDPYLGVVLGPAIGFVSSLFGIGGGILYVPAMVLLMRFPAYIATATSTTVLVFTSAAGAAVHLWQGDYSDVVGEAFSLSVGVVVGAQFGAWLSTRLRSQVMLLRLLSLALVVVGARLLSRALL